MTLDTLLLAEDLGEAIEGVASGEVGSHLVYGDSRVLVVVDLDVHGHFEFKVGGDDTRFPIMFLKVGPKEASSIHGFGHQIPLNLGGQPEHDVSDGFLVIVLPILNLLLVLFDFTLRWDLSDSNGIPFLLRVMSLGQGQDRTCHWPCDMRKLFMAVDHSW